MHSVLAPPFTPRPAPLVHRASTWPEWLLFFAGASLWLRIHLIGELLVAELLLLTALVAVLYARPVVFPRPISRVIVAMVAWLVAQMVTDIVRDSALVDWTRGWAGIGMSIVLLAAFCCLIVPSPGRGVRFAQGAVVGGFLQYFLAPTAYSLTYWWKFGLGGPVSMAVVLVAERMWSRGRIGQGALLLGFMGVVDVMLGARSLGGGCLLAALFVAGSARRSRRRGPKVRTTASGTWGNIAKGAFAALAVLFAYTSVASSGLLGAESTAKYEDQSSGQYGVLIGGRPEVVLLVAAIRHSPWLGHGSWAKWEGQEREEAIKYMNGLGYQYSSAGVGPDAGIPLHSYLLGAWVQAGLVGGLVWLGVLLMVVRMMARGYAQGNLSVLRTYLGVNFVWASMFSPFGAEQRAYFAFTLVMLVTVPSSVSLAKDRRARGGRGGRSRPNSDATGIESGIGGMG